MALASGVYAEKEGKDVPPVAPAESVASTYLPAGRRSIELGGLQANVGELEVSPTGISVEMSDCIINIKEVYIEKAPPQKQFPTRK